MLKKDEFEFIWKQTPHKNKMKTCFNINKDLKRSPIKLQAKNDENQ